MGKSINILLIMAVLAMMPLSYAMPADSRTATRVKVIHAATGPEHIDPALQHVGTELKSVFKYTSYRLINEKTLILSFNQEGRMNLPDGKVLIVTPADMAGNRIRYQIDIQKNRKSIFRTRVLLRNNSSITIGGPQFRSGLLLFNIEGSLN